MLSGFRSTFGGRIEYLHIQGECRQKGKCCTRVRGLTILEVMLAMGILAISVLLILGVLARFLTAQSSTAAQTAAKLIAKEVLDQAAAVALTALGVPVLTGEQGARAT